MEDQIKIRSQAPQLTPVIPAVWETEMYRIEVRGQPGKKVLKSPSQQISAVIPGTQEK
jgi:hypothetical protein